MLVLLTVACSSSALEISGITHAGMEFRGSLDRLDESSISIIGKDGLPVGIFLDSVKALNLRLDTGHPSTDKDEVKNCLGLAPYLSDASLENIFAWIVGGPQDLESSYLWAEEILQHADDQILRDRARIWKLRTYLQLGQFAELSRELEVLRESVPPMEATAELCLLHAERYQLEENNDLVLFWSELPFLRIPAYSGILESRLHELHEIASGKEP